MDKKDLIKKIKFMEISLKQGEKLNLMCRPTYGCWGDFGGLNLFFLSDDMTEEAIINSDCDFYVVVNYSQVKDKKRKIKEYIESFCHCYDNFSFDENFDQDDIPECTCKLPTQEEAEEWWYNDLLKKIEERSKFIKEKIREA
ncbi:hypothetical protein RSJ2_3838 (plasmid) [Clostridium botulinum]|uniref:hypothetical protein n=1 Tax=Clostridium botulinum TaxID=1491 RepID=UPI0003FA933C|nr:hypothetical protein [Clostridium botulinum]APR02620.1 hypothetical protein RSJ2_3838 [Clostridium botulinum]AUN19769.1 hypothetical protein B2M06_19645 [Clostridium botulinum]NFM82231.1 hypothetical protein [Clostridium botulinum]NFP09922.1 hypothetical protein [Clostridium botulinum]NFR28676.1 hypothetical protein [Clostridium botulinum]